MCSAGKFEEIYNTLFISDNVNDSTHMLKSDVLGRNAQKQQVSVNIVVSGLHPNKRSLRMFDEEGSPDFNACSQFNCLLPGCSSFHAFFASVYVSDSLLVPSTKDTFNTHTVKSSTIAGYSQ